MLSMGTAICVGIVPELILTATASSGIKWIQETHGQEDEQSEYGTPVHVIIPELVKGTIIHISPLCCESYYFTRHISHVYDMESLLKGSESLSTCTAPISVYYYLVTAFHSQKSGHPKRCYLLVCLKL